MANEALTAALERLSILIDPIAQEKRRWANDEGVTLARAVGWAKESIAEQAGFSLVAAKPLAGDTQELMLSHEGRQKREVATIYFKVAPPHLLIWAKPNEAAGFSIEYPAHQEVTRLEALDEASVGEALTRTVLRLSFSG
jgi:hypothetical protein